MMCQIRRILLMLAAIPALSVSVAVAGPLLPVQQVGLADVSLLQNQVSYNDSTYVLTIFSYASQLKGASSMASTPGQSYVGGGTPADTARDQMLSIQLDAAGNFVSGTVTIGFGNTSRSGSPNYNAAAFGFSWTGTVTGFGYTNDGARMNATWTMNADQYRNMPAAYSLFVNNYLAGAAGGIDIGRQGGWVSVGTQPGGGANFANGNFSWTDATVDVYAVPLPAGLWLLGSGLALLAPAMRRRVAVAQNA